MQEEQFCDIVCKVVNEENIMDVKDLTGSKKGNGNPQPNTVSLFQREINRMFDNFFPGLDLVPDFYKGTTG
ncbi:MAG: hypothetical protein K8R21_06525, partial [Leptospira sp.]|nr:hypothetical protein [Leptospira sp.]